MRDEDKTKVQLIDELKRIKRKIAEFEKLEIKHSVVEKALRDSEQKYKTLLEEAPIGIYFSDFKGTFLYGNKMAEKIVGYSKEELLGKSFLKLKLLNPEGIKKAMKLLAKNKLGKVTGPDEFVLNKKDDSKSIVAISTRITKIDDHKVVLGMVQDITEPKRLVDVLHKSEEQYRLLCDGINGFISVYNSTGILQMMNIAAAKNLGGIPSDFVGKPIHEIHPADAGKALRTIREVIRTGGDREYDLEIELTSGKRWYRSSFQPVRDSAGGIWAVLVISYDITEHKWLVETKKAIMDASPDYIAVVDRNGNVLDINKAMAKRFGKKPEKLIGVKAWELIPQDLAESRRSEFEKVFQTGKAYRFEDENRGKYFDNIVYPVGKEHGEVTRVAVRARDINKRKKAEDREKKLQMELNQSSRLVSIGQLVAGIAHEINNPLTGILGFSERLLKKSTDDSIKHDLERIRSEALRATRVIDNLRTFAHHVEPKREYSDVNEILKKTIELRSYELKTGNIEVEVRMTTDLPSILVDFEQIQEVFLNLLLNAEQAVIESERKGKIKISTGILKDRIRISFTDNGLGIPTEYQERVFDPFFTLKEKKGGSGLGLSICHGIVTRHGGNIYVKSKPGNGSTFFVELPTPDENINEE